MLKVRYMSASGTSPRSRRKSKIGGTSQRSGSMIAAQPSGRMRGTFSVRPPPVIWAIPFTQPVSITGRTGDWYERCGRSSSSPTVQSSTSTTESTRSPSRSKRMRRASE